jgi:hypothetical protein
VSDVTPVTAFTDNTRRFVPVVVTAGAVCDVPAVGVVPPVPDTSIGVVRSTPEYALIEPAARADCERLNTQDAGSPATTAWRHVVSPTPATAFAVTAVQPAGAVVVVGVEPPAPPVDITKSSRYQFVVAD